MDNNRKLKISFNALTHPPAGLIGYSEEMREGCVRQQNADNMPYERCMGQTRKVKREKKILKGDAIHLV